MHKLPIVGVFVVFLGLSSSSLLAQSAATTTQKPNAKPAAAKDAGHSHATHGPHEGELLEVGKEEYHLEVCTDEKSHKFVIYLMDKDVKTYVALDAAFIAVNAKQNGKAVQYKLKPTPQAGDAPGRSSSFAITSPELFAALHDHHADPRIAVKIGNKPYSVKVLHSHDHAGHSHSSATGAKPKTVR